MTKSILWFATCGLILASCSKTEVGDSDPGTVDDVSKINFITSTSRAAINDLAALQDPTTGGFHVYAANNSATGWHQDINGIEYKHTSGVWDWVTPPVTPTWPTADEHYPMKFYAHHPKTATGFAVTAVATAPEAANTSVTADITIQGTSVTQVDFLGATNTTTTKPPTGKLTIAFDHITSKINFGIITGIDVTAYVNKVDVNALVDAGTYDYTTKAWDLGTTLASANYDYFDEAGAVNDFSNLVTTQNLKSPIYNAGHSSHLMLVPQATTPVWDGTATEDADGNATGVTGAYIGMIYRLETAVPADENAVGYKMRANCIEDTEWAAGSPENAVYNNTSGSYAGPLYVKVGFPMGTNPVTWNRGKGYTYNMKLGTTDATGGLYLSKYYYDEEGKNTKILVDGTPVITDPVAGGDIHFDVSVDEWVGEPDTDL